MTTGSERLAPARGIRYKYTENISFSCGLSKVIKLREHELRWAESTAHEMSLRAELCTLKDEHATAVGDAAIFKKRCEALQRENTELGER